ncbi:MAG: molybdopterin oxidoreductase, partial [Chloroflexi bacterium]|nr:molybdopterin oxidoreductase [Chloroflexota bacterium]
LGEHFFGGDLDKAFDHQLAPSGLSLEQLRAHSEGMRVAGQTRYRKYADIDAQTGQPRGFQTPTRKLEIYSTSLSRAGYAPLPMVWEPAAADADYPLALTFARLVQFCDDGYRNIPRLRRQVPVPFLEIHPSTASDLGIEANEWVVLETPTGAVTLTAKLNPSLDPRVVATQYGWWQACQQLGAPPYDPFRSEGANANLLISSEDIDPISGSVPHRSQRCRVRKPGRPGSRAG